MAKSDIELEMYGCMVEQEIVMASIDSSGTVTLKIPEIAAEAMLTVIDNVVRTGKYGSPSHYLSAISYACELVLVEGMIAPKNLTHVEGKGFYLPDTFEEMKLNEEAFKKEQEKADGK